MKNWALFLLLALAGIAMGYGWSSEREARREAQERLDSLGTVRESLKVVYRTDTVRLNRWKTRWDSILVPGVVDTLPPEIIIQVADSAIRACTAALSTCEQRVAVAEGERDTWKQLARGRFITPALELSTTLDLRPEAAFDLTLGRGRLKGLARVTVADSAAFRLGVRWQF